jgi:phosphoribosylformylglycinamidine (FGAM) synthase PurS component
VHEMAATLLSNPVIEDYEVRVVEADLQGSAS